MQGHFAHAEPALVGLAAVALVGGAGAALGWARVAGYVEDGDAEVATEPEVEYVLAVEVVLAVGADVGLLRLMGDEERRRVDGVGQEKVPAGCSCPRIGVWDEATGMRVEERVECCAGAFGAEGAMWQRLACSA